MRGRGLLLAVISLGLAGCTLRTFTIRSDAGAAPPDGGDGDGGDVGDAGRGDRAPRDGGDGDACTADLANDPGNCGACGHVCSFANAIPLCREGHCLRGDCLPGFHDLNGDPADGCEYPCTVTYGGIEACDGRDNDCDGLIDEETDLLTDVNNCGACGNRCAFAHAGESCVAGACALGACEAGWHDANGLMQDGCECQVSNGGVEVCDGIDNDCNGVVDDVPGLSLEDDPQHCGVCSRNCTALPHAAGTCASGQCVLLGCEYGWVDLDGLADTGCEYSCPDGAPGEPEVCDGVDNDCNGLVDADDPGLVGVANFCRQLGACAGSMPVCTGGRWVCNYGSDVELVGPNEIVANETRCDGIDNDCDGCVDESFPQVGRPAGATCAAKAPDPCVDSGVGACQGRGVFICDAAHTGVECLVTQPGAPPSAEVCDGIDNDCDGVVDNADPGDPARVVEPMVAVSGGGLPGTVWVYAYEASRPDATGQSGGSSSARACAKAGAVPWTNLAYAQAAAACTAAGKRLCTEAEWQRACETAGSTACAWSFATACTGRDPSTCNTSEYDSDPGTPGNQDAVLPTGSLQSCYADWGAAGRIYDLTGNAKEFTQARAPNQNPLRGGSYDNVLSGSTCGFSFTVVGDSFHFSNTGFRCCSDLRP